MVFSINTANEVTLLNAPPSAPEGVDVFTSSKDLTQTTLAWPYARLVEVWNRLAPRVGLKLVAKFENRTKAIVRIWRAVEILVEQAAGADTTTTMGQLKDLGAEKAGKRECARVIKEQASASLQAPADLAALAVPKSRKAKRTSKKADKPVGESKAPRDGTAKATVLAMIERKGGATPEEIMKATGWQAHTCRGFMSVAPKKAGLEVISSRRGSDKARVYEVAR